MRAASLVAPGRLECREFEVPEPGPGQVLVRTHRASICGSDLHAVFDGFSLYDPPGPPGYPGHEGVGEVVAVGPGVAGATPGQPVLCAPEPLHARCFAEYQVVFERSLVALPVQGDLDRLLLAQQLGTVLYAARRFLEGVDATGTAVVIGAGSIGLYFVQVLRHAGFEKIVVADLEPERLEVARELGATTLVLAPAQSVVEAVGDSTAGLGAALVIEAAGYDATREQAIGCAAAGGRVGLFGYPEARGLAPFPFEAAFRKALTIQTSVGTQLEPGLRSFREAAAAIHAGDYVVDYMLAPAFPIERVDEAMEAARARQGVKVGVVFGAG